MTDLLGRILRIHVLDVSTCVTIFDWLCGEWRVEDTDNYIAVSKLILSIFKMATEVGSRDDGM